MRAASLMFLIAVWLTACGYKGPLYLPPPKPAASKPRAPLPVEPPPQRPVPSEAVPAPQ